MGYRGRKAKKYDVYDGEKLIMSGEAKDVAIFLGVTSNTVRLVESEQSRDTRSARAFRMTGRSVGKMHVGLCAGRNRSGKAV